MDQRLAVEEKLLARFGAGSSCPGAVDVAVDQKTVAELPMVTKQVPPEGIGKKVKNKKLDPAFAGLDEVVKGDIASLLALEDAYNIRAYMSEDGFRAGIYAPHSFWDMDGAMDIFKRYSRIFFGLCHVTICLMYEEQLKAAGRRYLQYKRDMGE